MAGYSRKDDGRGQTGDDLMLEAELADRWRRSPRTLQRWRSDGRAPPYLKLGQRVLYRRSDVEEYEARHRNAGDAP